VKLCDTARCSINNRLSIGGCIKDLIKILSPSNALSQVCVCAPPLMTHDNLDAVNNYMQLPNETRQLDTLNAFN